METKLNGVVGDYIQQLGGNRWIGGAGRDWKQEWNFSYVGQKIMERGDGGIWKSINYL